MRLFELFVVASPGQVHGTGTQNGLLNVYKSPGCCIRDQRLVQRDIPQFCLSHPERGFADGARTETFTFVLTQSDGTRLFCFCRRCDIGAVFRDSDCKESLCVVSLFPYFSLFSKLLQSIHVLRQLQPRSVHTFLEQFFYMPFPLPGEAFRIPSALADSHSFVYVRPDDDDAPLADLPLSPLFDKLQLHNVLLLVSALLCEKRVIVTASSMSTLSSCCLSALALLYPFSWRHIFIPSLPSSMLDYLMAPMPFFVGLLHQDIEEVEKMDLSEIVFVDLDDDRVFCYPESDSVLPLPPVRGFDLEAELSKILAKRSMRSQMKKMKAKGGQLVEKLRAKLPSQYSNLLPTLNTLGTDSSQDETAISELFLIYYLLMFGSASECILTRPNTNQRGFDKTLWISSQPDSTRQFASIVAHSQLLECLVDERCNASTIHKGIFDRILPFIAESVSNIKARVRASNKRKKELSDVEKQVLNLTSNSTRIEVISKFELTLLLNSIAAASFDCIVCDQIMSILWSRLKDGVGSNWRHSVNSLYVLKHLIGRGSEVLVAQAWDRLDILQGFSTFNHPDSTVVRNVREAATAVCTMLTNRDALRDRKGPPSTVNSPTSDQRRFGSPSTLTVSTSETQLQLQSQFVPDRLAVASQASSRVTSSMQRSPSNPLSKMEDTVGKTKIEKQSQGKLKSPPSISPNGSFWGFEDDSFAINEARLRSSSVISDDSYGNSGNSGNFANFGNHGNEEYVDEQMVSDFANAILADPSVLEQEGPPEDDPWKEMYNADRLLEFTSPSSPSHASRVSVDSPPAHTRTVSAPSPLVKAASVDMLGLESNQSEPQRNNIRPRPSFSKSTSNVFTGPLIDFDSPVAAMSPPANETAPSNHAIPAPSLDSLFGSPLIPSSSPPPPNFSTPPVQPVNVFDNGNPFASTADDPFYSTSPGTVFGLQPFASSYSQTPIQSMASNQSNIYQSTTGLNQMMPMYVGNAASPQRPRMPSTSTPPTSSTSTHRNMTPGISSSLYSQRPHQPFR